MQTGEGLEEEPESSRRGREGESMPLLIAQWLFQNVNEITLWLRKRLERLRVSASGRARVTRNSSKRFLRHKVHPVPRLCLAPLTRTRWSHMTSY